MSTKAKIACTIDREVMDRVERLRARSGESRSAVINRALATLVDEAAQVAKRERYVAAYREQPETAADVDAAKRLSRGVLPGVPWDDA